MLLNKTAYCYCYQLVVSITSSFKTESRTLVSLGYEFIIKARVHSNSSDIIACGQNISISGIKDKQVKPWMKLMNTYVPKCSIQ